MQIEAKLEAMGLTLPQPPKLPPGVQPRFSRVRVRGNRAYIAGHTPLNPDGTFVKPGKVGEDMSAEDAYQVARLTGLAILSSLKRELGDLDRVTAWLRVCGWVNATPGFTQMPTVLNGFSELVLELYGAESGAHARSAVGATSLPMGMPVEIEAEVEIAA